MCLSIGSAQVIYHKSPNRGKVGEDLELSVTLFTDIPVSNAIVYFRETNGLSFSEINMNIVAPNWTAIIPGGRLSEKGFEYCIVVNLSDGSSYATPQNNPFENPHKILIEFGEDKFKKFNAISQGINSMLATPDVLILSPEPSELVRPENVVIAVSLFSAPQIDSSSIRIELDGVDKTSASIIESGIVSFTPNPLTDGLHTIDLHMSTAYGMEIEPLSWSFTVTSGMESMMEEFEYGGNLRSRMSLESISGVNYDVKELTGEGFVTLPFAEFKVSFRQTSRESEFQQPQNRMSGSFKMSEFVQLKFGDFNPRLSPFLIDGRRIRGTGVSLEIPWVRFQYVSGELNRIVQNQDGVDNTYKFLTYDLTTDSTGKTTYALDRVGYTFQRNMTALKLSVGPKYGLHAGVHVLQARDDINSVRHALGNYSFTVDSSATGLEAGTYSYNDFFSTVDAAGNVVDFKSDHWGGAAPEDNLVFGFDMGTSLDDRKLTIDFTWNMSLFNRDIWDGVMTRAEMDTALDDSLDGLIGVQYDEFGNATSGSVAIDTSQVFDPVPWKSFFIMNANMSPLVPFDVTTFETNPISTIVNMPSSAFSFKVKGHYAKNNFILEYRQVGPEYVSLGNPYLSSNVRDFLLSNRLALLDYKMFITGFYKYRDNEILKATLDPLNTTTLGMNMSLNPGADSPSYVVNFQSIGKYNEKTNLDSVGGELVDLREDSRAVNTLTSVNIPLTILNMTHFIVINYNTIKNTDKLESERAGNYLFPKTDTETLSLNLSSKFYTPLRSNISFSKTELYLPFTDTDGTVSKAKYIWTTAGLAGQYGFLNQKLRVSGGFSYLASKGLTNSTIMSIKGGADWDVVEGMTAIISGVLQLTNTGDKTEVNTTGIILKLRYNF
ncbi:MAG: hypothetical protein HN517_08395 [Candidatus Marinimicrobia bacterium]|nr:hypothetical protein [Candidatus Neomarinimicrobiota bacterium]MBT6390028.1 hypothetical protein [Candidatus Neomarinimicrobiota bacterium]